MTSSKKYKYEGLPGFDIDPETGRYFPVPVDFKAVFGDNTEKQTHSWKWRSSKKSNETHVQPIKYRKNEIGVRKELFRVPASNWQPSVHPNTETRSKKCSTGARRSLAKTLPSSNDSDGVRKLKLEKKNISSLKRTVGQPDVKQLNSGEESGQSDQSMLVSTPRAKSPIKENKNGFKTPNSDELDMSEFLNLENQYKTPKIVVDSPVSTVCSLFDDTMVLSNENADGNVTHKKIINEMYRIIELDEELCKDTSNKIKEVMEQQKKHEQNLKLIASLVKKLDEDNAKCKKNDDKEENKENSLKRRSLRLQNKISPKNRGALGSPVILKSGDLRKTTLTKSLVRKYHKYQIESPRIQRALNMYNTTKKTCNALLSPKISRGQLNSPLAGTGFRNNLSLTLQNQCLMLQDTPKHK